MKANLVTRRGFLAGSLAFGTAPFLRAADAGCRLTLGVMSDIHIRKGTAQLETAFARFVAAKCDGVVLAGDLADAGFLSQLKTVGNTWRKAFPGGKNPIDGRPVEKLFVYGNHDYTGYHYGYATALKKKGVDIEPDILANVGFDTGWRTAFEEEFAPIWTKRVNGYFFIGAHWLEGGASPKGLEDFFARAEASLDRTRPFFYIQHAHPKDTCYGKDAWGADNGVSTRVLSRYPNAVAFSGHSHFSLTDERSLWQGAFTSIGTSSLSYSGRPDAFAWTRDPTNLGGFLTRDGNQGQIVRVYDDRLEIERLDVMHGTPLGAPWRVPIPARADGPLATATRKAALGAPAFTASARVAAKVDGEYVVFEVPPAVGASARAFTFLVEIAAATKLSRRFIARTFHLPPGKDDQITICPIRRADVPAGATTAVISPVSCFDSVGKPLCVALPA